MFSIPPPEKKEKEPLFREKTLYENVSRKSSHFLSNLLVLLLRILNSGISDSGLLVHLSEATAGSLNAVGHSTAYEELVTYKLAVHLFLANEGPPPTPASRCHSQSSLSTYPQSSILNASAQCISDVHEADTTIAIHARMVS